MTYRVAVAVGSNLGERLEHLRHAVEALGGLGEVEAVSSLYETAPVGGPEQDPYLNAVVVVSTSLAPKPLLEKLLAVEEGVGRVRQERWGPRPLDLDLITALDSEGVPVRLESDELQLPHPRAHLRRFVLAPLSEVWPDAPLPGGTPAADFLPGVSDQQVEILGRDWADRRMARARALLAAQALLFALSFLTLLRTGRRPRRADPWAIGGGAAAATGGAIIAWAVASLGPAVSPYPEPRPGTELVAHGPYRRLRHPIYSGLVLGMVGLAAAVRSWPGMLMSLLLGGFFSVKARYEESRLRIGVPGYAAYQRRVQARLIPGARAPT